MAKGTPEEGKGEQMGGSKININTATKDELARVHGIGNDRAEEIVRYREQHNGFKSLDDLDNVPWLMGKLSNEAKSNLTV